MWRAFDCAATESSRARLQYGQTWHVPPFRVPPFSSETSPYTTKHRPPDPDPFRLGTETVPTLPGCQKSPAPIGHHREVGPPSNRRPPIPRHSSRTVGWERRLCAHVRGASNLPTVTQHSRTPPNIAPPVRCRSARARKACPPYRATRPLFRLQPPGIVRVPSSPQPTRAISRNKTIHNVRRNY